MSSTPAVDARPDFTGERAVPEVSLASFLQEHAARYVFGARYCAGYSVLDVASGTGYGTDYLRRKGANAVGLEIDGNSVRISQNTYPESAYRQGNAEEIPLEWNEQFDRVVSFETIEHISDPNRFLEGVYRCLRPGGLFICSTPNKNLCLFEGGNRFHLKEFYRGEFLRFIGSRFRILDSFGQSLHPWWHVFLLTPIALAAKLRRLAGIESLGIGRAVTRKTCPAPFNQSHLQEELVLPEFLPCAIPARTIPTFMIVVAQKAID